MKLRKLVSALLVLVAASAAFAAPIWIDCGIHARVTTIHGVAHFRTVEDVNSDGKVELMISINGDSEAPHLSVGEEGPCRFYTGGIQLRYLPATDTTQYWQGETSQWLDLEIINN